MDSELKDALEQLGTQLGDKIESLSSRVDSHSTFMRENVALKLDIQDLREDMADKQDIDRVLTSVDAYAKQSKDYVQEVKVASAKASRLETWTKDIAAPKLGIKYDI